MVEGLLMKHAAADMQKMFTDPAASSQMAEKALADIKQAPDAASPALAPVTRFLGELKTFMGTAASAGPGAAAGGSNEWQPLKVTARAVAREYRGPAERLRHHVPARRDLGLDRMRDDVRHQPGDRTHARHAHPAAHGAALPRADSRRQGAGVFRLDHARGGDAPRCGARLSASAPRRTRSSRWRGVSAAICFVGFMMLIASLGKTEQSASGAAWAIMMPLSMIGGAMVPQFVMPAWMQAASVISPIRWALLSRSKAACGGSSRSARWCCLARFSWRWARVLCGRHARLERGVSHRSRATKNSRKK